jgi:hypothetical protein
MKNYNSSTPQTHTRRTSKKVLLVLLSLLIVASFVIYALYIKNNDDTVVNDSDDSFINYAPATEEERSDADLNKERIVAQKEDTQSAPSPRDVATKQTVTPVFGYIQQSENSNIEANGYISEAIEEGGTCTLELTKDDVRVTTYMQARPSAQSTVCGLLAIDRSKLSPGEWSATIVYSSASYEGTSQERKVKVQ